MFGRTGDGADVEGVGLDGLEEYVDVECREGSGSVDVCDCFCEGAFCFRVCEGRGWVVDDPKWHDGGWGSIGRSVMEPMRVVRTLETECVAVCMVLRGL